jgi:CRP-like cAMP-binding protein
MARCLGRGDLFPFTGEEIELLATSIGVRRFGAGAPLLHEGKAVEFMGLIETGEVELYHRTALRRVALQILREGDLLGDIPFFCRMPAPFSARAVSDAVVIEIDRDTLTRLLETQPALANRFMFSLASRLERMQRRLLQLTTGDLRSQVATLLLDEVGDGSGPLRLPQATLAELLGATRPSVNRVLKALESEGLLRLTYRQIEVRDASGLRGVVARRKARALG